MAFPTAVNSQITDAVTQTNVKVLGNAPNMAIANLYQATAQALSNAAHNATTAQEQANVTAQASTTMGVSTLYALDTATTGNATQLIFGATLLSGPGVTAAHIANAQAEKPLLLYVSDTDLDATHVQQLAAHRGVQVLHLDNVRISGEHLETLRGALPDTRILCSRERC